MRIKLLDFDFDIKYIPGKEMYIADLLSRNFLNCTFDNELNMEGYVHSVIRIDNKLNIKYNIDKETQDDPILSKVYEYCLNGWPRDKKMVLEHVRLS